MVSLSKDRGICYSKKELVLKNLAFADTEVSILKYMERVKVNAGFLATCFNA